MGRPILGASKSFYVLVDSLIAGVRKTQEDTSKVFISIVFSMQNKEHKGENRL